MDEYVNNLRNKSNPCLCNDEFNNWISLKNNGFKSNEIQVKPTLPNINEFKTFLKSLVHLQKLFQKNLLLYNNNENDKQVLQVKLNEIKEQMEIFHQILTNDSYIESVKKKLRKISKRRKYFLNKNDKFSNNELEKQRRIKELDVKTEQWLLSKREEENDKKIRKIEKRKVKSIISDVGNRIKQINEKIDLIDSAIKLRQLRKKDKHDCQSTEQINDDFDNEILSIKNLLASKLESYEIEKKNIIEQSSSVENQSRLMESKTFRLSVADSVNKMLFGESNKECLHSDYERFYKQAMHDINHFLLIRSHWDSYVVNDPSNGSCLPVTWVLPSPASDSSWQRFLE